MRPHRARASKGAGAGRAYRRGLRKTQIARVTSLRERSVDMPVVHVRHMGMGVPERGMPVRVGMRCADRIVRRVDVRMMLVVDMRMRMDQHFMLVLVLVAFGEMKPGADAHEQSRGAELHG